MDPDAQMREPLRHATSLWTEAAGVFALRCEPVGPPAAHEVVVRALHSAVSRGTERLVLTGAVPPGEAERMRGPGQVGDFGFPLKYGYALVGRVEDGPPDLRGRIVFALHPHQSVAVVDAAAVTPVPAAVPPRRATLAANMETALTVVWDSGASVGDRVLVLGAGVVGLLVARLMVRIGGTEVVVCDREAGRRAAVEAIGARFAAPADIPAGVDVAVDATGAPAALQLAIDATGREGRIVLASWHGTLSHPLALGGAFHSQRLAIVSSQVSAIPPARAPRWDHRRRREAAMRLLDDAALDVLFTHDVALEDAPRDLSRIVTADPAALAVTIRYPAA